MASNSNIEWTEATWNPIAGCTPVSSGCLHCYAATMAHRLDKMGQAKYAGLTVLRNGVRTFNGKINLDEPALSIPLSRKKPTIYFVNSMSDLFHEGVPFEFVDKVFAVMALCPQHTFQVLTKRPERMAEYTTAHSGKLADRIIAMRRETGDNNCVVPLAHIRPGCLWWPLANVWLGTSVENQKAADERIPHLLRCPAAVRFLSCEPLLGPVDLKRFIPFTRDEWSRIEPNWKSCYRFVDWVIVGGESGPGARNCYTNWIDSIVAQCKATGVAVFVKQLGSKHRCVDDEFGDVEINLKDKKGGDMAEFPADLRVREFPKGVVSAGG